MPQLTIDDYKGWRILMHEDGQIYIETEMYDGTFEVTTADLLYILQTYQDYFGGIKVKANIEDWRGVIGDANT